MTMTAAPAVRKNASPLSEEQCRQYGDDGFLIVRDFFSPAQIAAAIGAALVIMPVAFNMFNKAPKGAVAFSSLTTHATTTNTTKTSKSKGKGTSTGTSTTTGTAPSNKG